jgi:hypothetical protein
LERTTTARATYTIPRIGLRGAPMKPPPSLTRITSGAGNWSRPAENSGSGGSAFSGLPRHYSVSRQAPAEQMADEVVAGLFREHGLSLVRLAVLLTGDQATGEDVVQDAFLAF